MADSSNGFHCDMSPPSYEGVDILKLHSEPSPADYLVAMAIANRFADEKLLGEELPLYIRLWPLTTRSAQTS